MSSEKGLSANLPNEVYEELRRMADSKHAVVTPRLRELLANEQRVPRDLGEQDQSPEDFFPPAPPDSV